MNIAELKLQLINKILQSDDADFEIRSQRYLNNDTAPGNVIFTNNTTVIAYRANGQPLTIKDLKTEILQITDDTKPTTHCSVKTRLKGILWL